MKKVESEYKLNPVIKQQAELLFQLIEKEAEIAGGDTCFAEPAAEQWGDALTASGGFDLLCYIRDIAQPISEEAILDLEFASYKMNDEAFEILTDLHEFAIRIAETWRGPKDKVDLHRLDVYIRRAEEAAKKAVKGSMSSLWMHRAMGYRRELEALKAKTG